MRTKHYYYDYGYARKKRNKTRDDAGIKFLFSVVSKNGINDHFNI